MSSITHPQVPVKPQVGGGNKGKLLVAGALGLLAALVATLVIVVDGGSPTPGSQEGVVPARVPLSQPGVRYDGGPEEGTRGPASQVQSPGSVSPTTRYDGGPEEGTRGLATQARPQVTEPQAFPGLAEQARNAGGEVAPPPSSIAATEGSAYGQLRRAGELPTTRYDGGPEEGTRGITP